MDMQRFNINEELAGNIDETYPLRDLAKKLKKSYGSIWKYATVGMRSIEPGAKIKLEVIMVGGVLHSTEEAYRKLVRACNKRNGQ